MKDPLNLDAQEHKVKQEQVIQQDQEYKYLGSIKKVPGLKLWSYHAETDVLKEVKPEERVAIGIDKKAHRTTKVNRDPKCIYFQALNRKNAEKKVLKMFKSTIQRLQELQEENDRLEKEKNKK